MKFNEGAFLTVRRGVSAALLGLTAWTQADAAAAESVLRFAASSDLRVIDPVYSLGYPTRNHGYLVYDTLFAFDSHGKVQPQMVESWQVSPDGMHYTFKLRPKLKWHDGTNVTAADCVASLKRWGERDPIGKALVAASSAMNALDAESFEIILKEPFGHVLEALGKTGSPPPFMMPERLAKISGFEQLTEIIGSGPFKFEASQWVPGDKAVYTKFKDYIPRSEPADFMAGGKVAKVDRIERMFVPNGATAVAALQVGEVDWVEHPPVDLLPLLDSSDDVEVRPVDPMGVQGMIIFNHLYAPFDNINIRRAVLLTIDQTEYLRALSSDERTWAPCRSFFFCGTRYGTDVAPGELLRKPDLEQARKLVKESGYDGTPVVLLDPVDDTIMHPIAIVLADKLQQIGLKTDVRATDSASVYGLMLRSEPVDKGGWNISVSYADSTNASNPYLNNLLRAGGLKNASVGWPTNAKIEQLRTAFLKATAPEEQNRLATGIQTEAFEFATQGLPGQYRQLTAYRKQLKGLINSPIPLFWNISKE